MKKRRQCQQALKTTRKRGHSRNCNDNVYP